MLCCPLLQTIPAAGALTSGQLTTDCISHPHLRRNMRYNDTMIIPTLNHMYVYSVSTGTGRKEYAACIVRTATALYITHPHFAPHSNVMEAQ